MKLKCWLIISILVISALAEPFTLTLYGVAAFGGATMGAIGYYAICKFKECCIDEYVPFNISSLKQDLDLNLFGQPMIKEVVHILEGHKLNLRQGTHSKALTISFHGWPGNGKNFVTNMIAKHIFVKGIKSQYFKLYKGGEFINPHRIFEYQDRIKSEIDQLVKSCPRSVIVFDEVHAIQPKVLDVLKPMIDYYTPQNNIDYSQAIFIFLSNLGGDDIMLHFSELSKPRKSIQLLDFEGVIRKAAYNSQGGLQESSTIFSHLIDHFIPFLPMEERHVKKCILAEFAAQGIHMPSQKMIEDVTSVLTFGPPENPIFANAGCKRIKKQVTYTIQRHRPRPPNESL